MNDLKVAASFTLQCIELESFFKHSEYKSQHSTRSRMYQSTPTICVYLFTIWTWKVNQKFALCNVNKIHTVKWMNFNGLICCSHCVFKIFIMFPVGIETDFIKKHKMRNWKHETYESDAGSRFLFQSFVVNLKVAKKVLVQ